MSRVHKVLGQETCYKHPGVSHTRVWNVGPPIGQSVLFHRKHTHTHTKPKTERRTIEGTAGRPTAQHDMKPRLGLTCEGPALRGTQASGGSGRKRVRISRLVLLLP